MKSNQDWCKQMLENYEKTFIKIEFTRYFQVSKVKTHAVNESILAEKLELFDKFADYLTFE